MKIQYRYFSSSACFDETDLKVGMCLVAKDKTNPSTAVPYVQFIYVVEGFADGGVYLRDTGQHNRWGASPDELSSSYELVRSWHVEWFGEDVTIADYVNDALMNAK